MTIRVFISHSSTDAWIAQQIARCIHECGATTFLDNADIHHGDDFEEKILAGGDASSELLVLLTPWARRRPYIWLEVGMFWHRRMRIVGVLLGLDKRALARDESIPIALKRLDLIALNEIDAYFEQLTQRVAQAGAGHGHP